MHPVCSSEDCVCRTRIPKGELSMKNVALIFGRIRVSSEVGNFIWHTMINLNIGHWIDKFIYRKFKKLSHVFKYFGVSPYKIVFETEECPYCGYGNSYDYWEDRNVSQTFPDGNWDNPVQ